MPSPGRISDLCKRLRCWIVCCGGTVLVVDDADTQEKEKETHS